MRHRAAGSLRGLGCAGWSGCAGTFKALVKIHVVDQAELPQSWEMQHMEA